MLLRIRPIYVVATAISLLVLLLIVLYAVDQAQADKIAKGVRVAGVSVGGLHPAQARAKLSRSYVAKLRQPVVVRFGAHRFELTASTSQVAVDLDGTVAKALARSRQGPFLNRSSRELVGGEVHADLNPSVTYSRAAVLGFVQRVKQTIDAAPRDAQVHYGAASIGKVSARVGHTVDGAALTTAVSAALANAHASHVVRPSVTSVRPSLTTAALAKRFPAIVTIDRANFRLRLWKRLKLVETYPIAVGQQGLETPAGLYHIQNKQVDPSWHVPNSAWAGSLAGMVIPPGPADPIKARWMGIFNGAGIHGTDELASLGSAASHGCIRMAIPDVIALYDQVSVGAPVFIA